MRKTVASQKMNVGIVGAGAIGRRLLRQIPDAKYVSRNFSSSDLEDIDLLVLANDAIDQPIVAGMAVAEGVNVLTSADNPEAVSRLLRLDTLARDRKVNLIVGAVYSPGLSCILASFLANQLDKLTEVHVARMGTGGPTCARNYHRALSRSGVEYLEGRWQRRVGGSGRELCWFPEPIGGADCYIASLAEPLLLARKFKDARRITAKRAATRRDRLTSPFPMLRAPHIEGGLGGIRVEVRGFVADQPKTLVAGSVALPAMAAAVVLMATAALLKSNPIAEKGAVGLAEVVNPQNFLEEVARHGIAISEFKGAKS